MTSNRLVRTEFFRDRVDGWLSLSGGRLGGSPGRAGSWPRGRMVKKLDLLESDHGCGPNGLSWESIPKRK
jgi:hypothetical protein